MPVMSNFTADWKNIPYDPNFQEDNPVPQMASLSLLDPRPETCPNTLKAPGVTLGQFKKLDQQTNEVMQCVGVPPIQKTGF